MDDERLLTMKDFLANLAPAHATAGSFLTHYGCTRGGVTARSRERLAIVGHSDIESNIAEPRRAGVRHVALVPPGIVAGTAELYAKTRFAERDARSGSPRTCSERPA